MTDQNRRIAVFLFVTCLFSWFFLGIFQMSAGVWGSRSAVFVELCYSMFPLVSTLIIHKVIWNQPLRFSFGKNKPDFAWILYSSLIPAMLTLLCIVLVMMYPRTKVNTNQIVFILPIVPILGSDLSISIIKFLSDYPALIVNLLGSFILSISWFGLIGFFEEAGWRGFYFRHFFEKYGFWPASLISGLSYGVWTFPLFYVSSGSYQVGLYGILLAILHAPIISFMRLHADSVIPAAILHGSFLAFSSFDKMFIDDSRGIGIFFIVYLVALILLNLGVLLFGMNMQHRLESLPSGGYIRKLPRKPRIISKNELENKEISEI